MVSACPSALDSGWRSPSRSWSRRPRAPRRRPGRAPRPASPVPATMRCGRRSSATCTSHTRFSADAYIYGTRAEPHDAYAFAKGAPIAVSDTDEAADPHRAPRSPARLRRRHRSRRVLRRGAPLRDAGLGPVRFDICRIFRSAETPQTPVPDDRPVALPRRHRQPAAVAALLHRARRRLRRRRGVGVAGPSRRRPRKPTTAPPRAPSPASSATSTRRARSAATCIATSSSATPTCRRSPTASSRPRPTACRRASGTRSSATA